MVLDGLRAYLQLANGLTEVTRQRATAAARALVAHGEASVDAVVPPEKRAQVGALAEDLVATSKANRHLLLGLVRVEVERTVNRLGLVSAAQLEAATDRARSLDDRVQELERQLRSARASAAAPGQPPSTSAGKKVAAKKSAGTSGRGGSTSGAASSGGVAPAKKTAKQRAKKTAKKTSSSSASKVSPTPKAST